MHPPPVLLIGEDHTQIDHQLIEKEALDEGRRHGYGVLAMEVHEDYQAPWQAYLRSPRTGEDRKELFHTLFPHRKTPVLNFAKLLSLSEHAADQGYRVLCIDIPRAAWNRQEDESPAAWMSRRNRHMADCVARDVKENHQGVIVQTGKYHILTARTPPQAVYEDEKPSPPPHKGEYTPLSTALKYRGLRALSTVLAVEGEDTAGLVRRSWTRSHLIADERAMGRLMEAGFQRANSIRFEKNRTMRREIAG